jgi:hypothetical protein
VLADAAGDHIIRSGQHANHGDVDREAPVQIKAVSVRRHSRAPARRAGRRERLGGLLNLLPAKMQI